MTLAPGIVFCLCTDCVLQMLRCIYQWVLNCDGHSWRIWDHRLLNELYACGDARTSTQAWLHLWLHALGAILAVTSLPILTVSPIPIPTFTVSPISTAEVCAFWVHSHMELRWLPPLLDHSSLLHCTSMKHFDYGVIHAEHDNWNYTWCIMHGLYIGA